jgi:chromosome segregation ATPase
MKCIDVFDSVECEKKIKNIADENNWIYYLKDNSGNAAYPDLNPTEHIYTTRDELDMLCNKYDEIGIQSKKRLDYLLTTNSNEVSDLKSNVLELNQQISVLNEENEKGKDLSKENQELKEKLIVVEEKINDKNTILDYMKKDINEKDKKIEKLNEKLIRKKEKIKDLVKEKEELLSWSRNENNKRLERNDEKEV